MPTLLAIVAWTCAAVTQLVMLSVALRVSRSIVLAALQAVLPFAAVLNLVVASFAVFTTNCLLLAASIVQVFWIALLVARLLSTHRRYRPAPRASSGTSMTLAHANLLYVNVMPAEAVEDLLATNADVITMSELTPDIHDALLAHAHAARWPHRHVLLASGADGIGLWSRHPLIETKDHRLVTKPALSCTIVHSSGQRIGLLVVHPMPPVNRTKTRDWAPSLQAIGDLASSLVTPTVAIGDFNTAFWHAPMRQLFQRGFRSAHLIHGNFLAGTFPVGKKVCPVVRLDHALVTNGVDVHDMREFTVAGSDHRGILVTVSTTHHAMH